MASSMKKSQQSVYKNSLSRMYPINKLICLYFSFYGNLLVISTFIGKEIIKIYALWK
jgi:hypothetical protein